MNWEDDDEPHIVIESQVGPMSLGGKFLLFLGIFLLIAFCFGGLKWVEYMPLVS